MLYSEEENLYWGVFVTAKLRRRLTRECCTRLRMLTSGYDSCEKWIGSSSEWQDVLGRYVQVVCKSKSAEKVVIKIHWDQLRLLRICRNGDGLSLAEGTTQTSIISDRILHEIWKSTNHGRKFIDFIETVKKNVTTNSGYKKPIRLRYRHAP